MKIWIKLDCDINNVMEILGLIITNNLQGCISDLKTDGGEQTK